MTTYTQESAVTDTADFQATQIYQVFIKATPEQIWEAITTPEFTRRYFHGARITVTPDSYRSLGPDGSVWGDAQVLEFDPPRRLVHGWDSLYERGAVRGADQPRDLGDRAAGRRLLPAERNPRPARELAKDRTERGRAGLDDGPVRAEDAARDRPAAGGLNYGTGRGGRVHAIAPTPAISPSEPRRTSTVGSASRAATPGGSAGSKHSRAASKAPPTEMCVRPMCERVLGCDCAHAESANWVFTPRGERTNGHAKRSMHQQAADRPRAVAAQAHRGAGRRPEHATGIRPPRRSATGEFGLKPVDPCGRGALPSTLQLTLQLTLRSTHRG